jgi:predicted RNA-binding Zn ribbon-like protein
MQTNPHTFRAADLVGGHIALDLVNTVTARNAEPVDWLDGYGRALEWAGLTGRFEPRVLADLERRAAAEPDAGALAIVRIRELREAVHDVLAAVARGDAVPSEPLARVEAAWKEAVGAASARFAGGYASLELDVERSRLDYLAHRLALDAFDLLGELPPERLRVCAGEVCGWLFIDTSKAGRRRWCDMATCGNAAKSRRHYERARAKRGR